MEFADAVWEIATKSRDDKWDSSGCVYFRTKGRAEWVKVDIVVADNESTY